MNSSCILRTLMLRRKGALGGKRTRCWGSSSVVNLCCDALGHLSWSTLYFPGRRNVALRAEDPALTVFRRAFARSFGNLHLLLLPRQLKCVRDQRAPLTSKTK